MSLAIPQSSYSHVENADPARVRSNARNVILERVREVAALSVVEAIVVAVASPVVVGADKDMPVDLSSTGGDLGRKSVSNMKTWEVWNVIAYISCWSSKRSLSSKQAHEGSEEAKLELHGDLSRGWRRKFW